METRGPETVPPGYRPLRLLGRGGMGEVWLVVREEDGVEVALKLLRRLDSASARLQFEREAVATLNLDHPNLVRGLSLGEEDGHPWLAMEYLSAGSLERRVERDGPLPEAEAIRIALMAARGLKEATRAGLVHRDVKPANLLLTGDGEVKVGDLGLLAVAADGRPGERTGTPAFMAPEQIRGEQVDLRADVYSLGLTLYYALTGRPAFSGRSARAILRAQLRDPLPDHPELSEGIRKVLSKMTAKRAEDRYRVWDELIIDLSELARGESPIGATIAALGRAGARRRWLLPALASAAALFLIVFLGFAVFGPGGKRPVAADPHPEETAARAELELTRHRIREHPEDLDRALDELRAVAARHPGTRAGREAARSVRDLEAKSRKARQARMDAARTAIVAKVDAGDLDAALAAIDAARRSLPAAAAPMLAELTDRVGAAAKERREQLATEVDRLVAGGRFEAARTRLAAAAGVRAGGIGEYAAARTKEVAAAAQAADRERRERIVKAYTDSLLICLRLAAEGKAGAVAERRQAMPVDAEALGDVPRLDGEILDGVGRAFRAALEGAAARKGRDAALATGAELVVGTVEGSRGDGILVEGRAAPIPVHVLDNATIAWLAGDAPARDLAAHALARGEVGRVAALLSGDDSPLAGRIRALAKTVPARAAPPAAPGLPTGGPRDPDRAKELAADGLDAYALGHLARAVSRLRAARAADPADGEIRLSLGLALLDLYREEPGPALRARILGELGLAKKLRPDLAAKNGLDRILKDLASAGR